MNNKYRKLINNTKIFAVGNIVSKLSQYIILALCSHRLTTAEFGVSETIIQTCAMLVPIFSADIAEGLFRFSMDKGYSSEQVVSSAMAINLFGSVIALVALPLEYLFVKSIRTSIFITILTLLELYQVSVKEFVRGLGLTRVYMLSGFIHAAVQVISCVIYIYVFNLGITGYILTISTAFLFEIIFCFLKVNIRQYIKKSSVSKHVLKALLKYTIPLTPNKIMWWIISASDRYFVLWLISASATGLYSVAAKFPALITVVVGFFFQAWQISAIEANENDEKDIFYSNIFNLLWSTIGVLTALVVVFIKLAVGILVAGEYFSSWEYAPFLLVATAFSAIQTFLGVNYTIAKDSMGALKSTAVAAAFNLGLNYILIKKIGIQGATIATLASYIIVSLYRYIDTRKYIKITVDNKRGLLITYSVLILECVVLWIFPSLYLITVPSFGIVLIANYKTCKTGFNYMKRIIVKGYII